VVDDDDDKFVPFVCAHCKSIGFVGVTIELLSNCCRISTTVASQMMYTSNNQNTNFSTPFQPHPSPHFNTHAYMIQAQHGPQA
ncbi:unnamed protein product, partial [Rotaria socialis]